MTKFVPRARVPEPAELSDEVLTAMSEGTDEGLADAVLFAMSYMPEANNEEGASEEAIQKEAHRVMVTAALELLRRKGLLEVDGTISFDPSIECMIKQTDEGIAAAKEILGEI